MRSDDALYRPIRFVDNLQGNNHIVLLYDDQKYADLIIARYILNGLQKGESCIFFTADDPQETERRLADAGIDVESYLRKNSLRVFCIQKSDENKRDVIQTLRGIRDQATQGMAPPYRFVGRTITDTASVAGMELGLTVEKTGHENFDDFDCSQLCYYDVSGIEPSRRQEWIARLLKNHHHVIFASGPERAVAFETMLLEPDEEEE